MLGKIEGGRRRGRKESNTTQRRNKEEAASWREFQIQRPTSLTHRPLPPPSPPAVFSASSAKVPPWGWELFSAYLSWTVIAHQAPLSMRFPRQESGNGNPLQHSCLENPTDRGAWRATVHGVADTTEQLTPTHTHTHTHTPPSAAPPHLALPRGSHEAETDPAPCIHAR